MEHTTTSYCPLCNLPITEDMFGHGIISDHYVYKAGELSYIELAHKACARRDNADNTDRRWQWHH